MSRDKINSLLYFLNKNNLKKESKYLLDIVKNSGDNIRNLMLEEIDRMTKELIAIPEETKGDINIESLSDIIEENETQEARARAISSEHGLEAADAQRVAEITSGVSSGAEQRANESKSSREVPIARAGEFILPKMRFESVSCSSCASEAVREAKEHWKNGYYTEKSPETYERQKAYWEFTNINNSADYNNIKNKDRWMNYKWIKSGDKDPNNLRVENTYHWSAVFISFIMAKYDGEGAKWYVYESHPGYLRDGKRNRKMIEKNPNDHIGKMYYVTFPISDINKYDLGIEPGDVVGRDKHTDIFVGSGTIVGGNSWAKNDDIKEHSGGDRSKTGANTSGEHPINMGVVEYVIKRIRVLGPGSENSSPQVA